MSETGKWIEVEYEPLYADENERTIQGEVYHWESDDIIVFTERGNPHGERTILLSASKLRNVSGANEMPIGRVHDYQITEQA